MATFRSIKEPNKFVMPLDSLDLSLLPGTYRSKYDNNLGSWWGKNNSNGFNDEYYQFEIKTKVNTEKSTSEDGMSITDIKDESENGIPQEKTTTCYICNLTVPTAYLSEHEDSLKHKAFERITDVVLKRARQQMLRKEDRSYIPKTDSVHFCVYCVTSIPTADKPSHDKSHAHKQSISFDKFLHQLVALYTDDDDELVTPGVKKVDDNANNINIDCNNTIVIGDNDTYLDKDEADKNTGSYDSEIDEDLSTGLKDSIEFETPDGIEIAVSHDNYHGFSRIGNTRLQCKLCKVIFKNEDEHKLSTLHIDNVSKPFKDKHCVRILDDNWSHCVICNEIVENSDIHALCNSTHESLLQAALINKSNFNETQKNAKLNAKNETQINEPEFNDNNDKVNEQINDKPTEEEAKESLHDTPTGAKWLRTHELFEKATSLNDTKKDGENGSWKDSRNRIISPVTEDESNIFIKEENSTGKKNPMNYCTVCDVVLHDNNLQSHRKGTKHTMNLRPSHHSSMKIVIGSKELVCRICNIYVPDDSYAVEMHVATTDHCEGYLNLLSINLIVQKNGSLYCKPCETTFTELTQFYHIQSTTHEKKLALFKEKRNQKPVQADSMQSENNYLCTVCNIVLTNNSSNIEIHSKGTTHQMNLKAKKQETSEETAQSQAPTSTESYMYYMILTDNNNELICKACQVKVPNNEENISEHVNGAKHIKKFKTLLTDYSIDVIYDKYFCKTCTLFIEDVFEHIECMEHRVAVLIGEKISNVTSEADAGEYQEREVESVVNTEKSEPITQKSEPIDVFWLLKHHFIEIGDDPSSLQCRICNVKVPNTSNDALNHANEVTHRNHYKDLMFKNLIFETDVASFYCGACNCIVPGKGEFDHVLGLRHNTNYAQITKSAELCQLCKVVTPRRDMAEHVVSKMHVRKIKETQNSFYHCKTCGALITDKATVINDHLWDCSLIKKHKLVMKDKYCFCLVCDQYFLRNLMNDHIECSHHLLLLSTSRVIGV